MQFLGAAMRSVVQGGIAFRHQLQWQLSLAQHTADAKQASRHCISIYGATLLAVQGLTLLVEAVSGTIDVADC